MWNDFLEALRFLTILPVPAPHPSSKASTTRGMFFFPLVGILIGLATLCIYILLYSLLSPRLANLILLLGPILLSGGRHLGGFAKFCDGFFGAKGKAETFTRMKDFRVGVLGAAGMILLILAKYEFLQELPLRGLSVLLALAAARWAQVALSFYLPVVAGAGEAGALAGQKVGLREFIGATAFLFVMTLFLGGPGLAAFIALVLFLTALGFWFQSRTGGVTEDLLGAVSELTEVFIFFIITVTSR